MTSADTVIPLERSFAGRMMLWVLATMVFLAVVALAVAGAADRVLGAAAENASVGIVSLAAPLDADRAPGDLAGVTAVLMADPEVARVDRMTEQEIVDLLGMDDAGGLVLPSLLEVRFRPAIEPDFERVTALVQTIVPDAVLEDAGKAGGARVEVAASLRLIGLVCAVVLMLAAVALVVMVTSATVRQHGDTVDLLRTMGAHDRYVSRQIGRHVRSSSIRAGLIGFIAAAVMLVAAVEAGQLVELPGIEDMTTQPLPWLVLAAVPVLLVAALTLTARITASWTLYRMN